MVALSGWELVGKPASLISRKRYWVTVLSQGYFKEVVQLYSQAFLSAQCCLLVQQNTTSLPSHSCQCFGRLPYFTLQDNTGTRIGLTFAGIRAYPQAPNHSNSPRGSLSTNPDRTSDSLGDIRLALSIQGYYLCIWPYTRTLT